MPFNVTCLPDLYHAQKPMVKVWTIIAAGVCVQLETPVNNQDFGVGCGARGLLIGMNMVNVLANTNTCVVINMFTSLFSKYYILLLFCVFIYICCILIISSLLYI